MSSTTNLAMEMAGPGLPPLPVEKVVPGPAPNEPVVRVRASSMNFHDAVNLMGLLDGPWSRVPMSDAAGTWSPSATGVTAEGIEELFILQIRYLINGVARASTTVLDLREPTDAE